ncbi:MAG TPA: GIY-YIG nuclease family protein [Terriglobales bacterium]|nr:GIY-YIG nuclease family protein [Terriglobales bacterium]
MAKISTVTLKGKSGQTYDFDVWAINQAFKAVAAVYAVTRRYQSANSGYSHDVIYIGQTEDLSTRFDDHHKADCFTKHKANCICTHLDDDEDSRLAKEQDLIENYNPPCNG